MLHSIRWTHEKAAQRLALIEPLVYRRHQPLPPFRYWKLDQPSEAPPVAPDLDDSAWPEVAANSYWAGWLTTFVLRASFMVPAAWDSGAPVALHLPLGVSGDFSHPEALAYIDGAPLAGCDRHHHEIVLPGSYRDSRTHQLALHGWTGLGGALQGTLHTQLFMGQCALVQIDQPTRAFLATARVALGAATHMADDAPARGLLLTAIDQALALLDLREPFGDAFYASVPQAHAALCAGIDRAGPPMLVDVVATGHAHIDVAWLWTLAQTRHKAARTFATALHLMEQYPEYHFTQSQPQLYDYIRQDQPAIFEGITRRVAEGRWEPIGGMWVEADCNLSGAESLARQFLLGRSFFRRHFGPNAETHVLWLPDVFGYAWALPQLIKQAGLEYFFTIKIGWSQYNRLPYDSFWWQGIDGTRVLTHFSTTKEAASAYASTYNASATPEQTFSTWTNFLQKDLPGLAAQPPLLMAYGYGDGGGGPTREMIENVREMAALPGTPAMRQGSVKAFFEQLEAVAGPQLPTWNGELYLEYHRGTYTTQARNKRANRKSEFLLHDAELLATTAALVDSGFAYPHTELRRAWELVCLNQFHDIIPGSSVHDVYVDSQRDYEEIGRIGEGVRAAALEALGRVAGAPALVANPTGFRRSGLVFLPGSEPAGMHFSRAGALLPAQQVEGGVLLAVEGLEPHSVAPLALVAREAQIESNGLTITPELLENEMLRVELNADGDITRIYDKRQEREVLPHGAVANQLQAFEDRPMNWDAWDIDIFYDDKQWLADPAESVQVVEAGPLRATLEVRRRILNSSFTQRISLERGSGRLDVETRIDWRERHVLLKVAFPVDVLAPAATYEIQWGNVQRPTHKNTSWDWARFETCAQKWVDLSEGDYGVSLLNDCKYGHDIRDNVIRLTLLRSPTLPDPEADQGLHHFAYSLLPHQGGWGAQTIAEAYALNDPLIGYQPRQEIARAGAGNSPVLATPLVFFDQENMVIETVKQAEDGTGVIVRAYESQRQRGQVRLQAGFPLARAWRTNLLEEDQEELAVDDSGVTLYIKPFEIITLRLVPA